MIETVSSKLFIGPFFLMIKYSEYFLLKFFKHKTRGFSNFLLKST